MNLEDIQVGEYVKTSGYGSGYRLSKVTRLTKTLAICGETKFNRLSGKRIGAQRWDTNTYGVKATENDLLVARGDGAKAAIKDSLKDMSPALALQLHALVKAQT